MSALPAYINPVPARPPSTWRMVAAAVALLCDSSESERCGAAEVARLLDMTPPGALRALHVAETRGAVRYVDGAWGPA